MTDTARATRGHSLTFVLALAVLAAADWWVWLGTDSGYQRDPETGVTSGPYETPQVVGCAVVLIVLAVLFRRWLTNGAVVTTVTLGFTVPWTVHAATRDSTGLFGVGTVMLLVGIGLGGTMLMQVLDRVAEFWTDRRRVPGSAAGADGSGSG